MYQPFPAAAAAAAEAGALKTDFMCRLCHPFRQMDGVSMRAKAAFKCYSQLAFNCVEFALFFGICKKKREGKKKLYLCSVFSVQIEIT